MRKNIVAGNWKMNKSLQEGLALATELNTALEGSNLNCDVVMELLLFIWQVWLLPSTLKKSALLLKTVQTKHQELSPAK